MMGVIVDSTRGRGDSNSIQQFNCAKSGLAYSEGLVRTNSFDQLLGDGVQRISAR
jgi:hypothetical protein